MANDDFEILEDPRDVPEDEQDRVLRKGLPERWSTVSDGPVWGSLPDGWGRLFFRYAGLGPSRALDATFGTIGRESPDSVLLESGYIDEDFRNEFSHFYAQTHRDLPSRCERLHFFGQDDAERRRYLGFVVLRPIVGRPVCRTMLAPPAGLREHVSCVSRASATPYVYPLSVEAFPFISQDSQYGTCSHAAIWMVSLYFHQRWRRPRYHLSDLAASARQHQDLLPAIPSGGLTPRQISAVLHDLGTPPLVYRLDRKLPADESVESIACRYLNSRLPVILLSEGVSGGHARVLVGYGRDDDGLFFVHHDDQRGPYLIARHAATGAEPPRNGDDDRSGEDQPVEFWSEAGEADADEAAGDSHAWKALVVPLPGRIYLAGESAERTARLIFEERIDAHEHLQNLANGLDAGRLRLRSYVTEVADYRRGLRRRGLVDDVVAWHARGSTSHWLWIVELQDRAAAASGRRCVLGELAIDATSDDQWPNPLFGNVCGVVLRWPGIGDDIEWAESDQTEPYETGCALHVAS